MDNTSTKLKLSQVCAGKAFGFVDILKIEKQKTKDETYL